MPSESEPFIGGRSRKAPARPARRGRPPQHTPAEKILLSLGARLKTLREEKSLTVAQVAKRTGIAPQTIIQLEDTGRPIRFPIMFDIAECLGHKLEFRLSKSKD